MTQIMIATEMTDGQIENAVGKLRDAMRKHRSKISSEVAQQILGVENLGMVLFAPFRERAEALSNCIVRTVLVDRALTPQASLDATKRRQYTTQSVVDTMPKGVGEKVELVYFKLGEDGDISCEAFKAECDKRGLVPDPQAQAADNAAHPAFADVTANACQWIDEDGNFCYAAFSRFGGERYVRVSRSSFGWDGYWWGAGVRK